jgi:lipoate-protein ligase A
MFAELEVIAPGEAFDGPMQMALDEILLCRVPRPTLRIYRWESPCVTFGYFQPCLLAEELHPGLPAVRRWTGGGVVLHGDDVTFSLMIPSVDPFSRLAPALLYRELHGAVAAVCGGRLAGDAEISEGPSCFSAPSRDDLIVGTRKVLGGAIRRSAGSLLYQGSLLNLPGVEMIRILSGGLCQDCRSATLDPDVISEARVLAGARYATLSWNRRR